MRERRKKPKIQISLARLKIHALGFHWKGRGKYEYYRYCSPNEDPPPKIEYSHAHVLEGLKPNSTLKVLTITDFMGCNFASWMMIENQPLLVNLVKVKLINCNRCEGITPLGHLPCLKIVEISGMNNVKNIGVEFYEKHTTGCGASSKTGAVITVSFMALRELTLEHMPKLEEWPDVEHLSCVFPSLEVLRIDYCKQLRTAPHHFPSIKELTIMGTEPGAWHSKR